MDKQCKKIKRTKLNDGATDVRQENDPSSTSCDYADICGSPELLSSQECFAVGWDWSAQIQGVKKPTVRLVDRPRRKRNEGNELLECHKPRRLVRKDNPETDASFILEELKLLSSDLKRVPESSSPVASPTQPLHRKHRDLLVTPTSRKSHGRDQEPTASLLSEAASSSVSSKTEAKGKENLVDLLDDSLGADILKFTQDIESKIKQNEDIVSNSSEGELRPPSSSKRKSRLSLHHSKSSEKSSKPVCRRIVSEETANKPINPQSESKIEFDEFDEAALLSINELEEKEIKISSNLPNHQDNKLSYDKRPTVNSHLNDDDDDDLLASPDILDLIEIWEKEATQDSSASGKFQMTKVYPKTTVKDQESNTMETKGRKGRSFITTKKEEPTQESKEMEPIGNLIPENRQEAEKQTPSRKKTLSLHRSVSKCTPFQIEQKRQEALRKRLQNLKKNN